MKQLAALLVLAVLFAPPALAEDLDPQAAVNQTVEDGTNATNGIIDGLQGIAEGIGDAAQATGEGIAKGASAVGRGFAAIFQAAGAVALAAITGLAHGGAAMSQGLLVGLQGLGVGAGWLGSAVTTAFVFVGRGAGFVGAGIWDGIVFAALGYAGFVESMRPEAMPLAVFGTVTAVGAAGSAGAGGWAGFHALRKWAPMAGLGGIAGFSRINNDDLLEHPMRANIFDVIKTNPGIHASQLARELEVGWGTITHHLDKLQKASLVTTRKVNNQKCFFEQGGEISRADMQIASALKGDTAAGIAHFVSSHPMTSQKQLAEALGISPALASFHVKKLVGLGVLDRFRHGKETLLTTSDGLRRIMASGDPFQAATMQDEGFEYSS